MAVPTARTLHVEALDALLHGRIAAVARSCDWALLEEIARLVEEDAPLDLAVTDPARFVALRNAVTRFHLAGWSHMTAARVRAVARRAEAGGTTPGARPAPPG